MKLKAPSSAAAVLTLMLAMLVATTIFAQQASVPRKNDERTAQRVAQLAEKFHISQERIDDTISERLSDAYLKNLDPQKLYFLKSDVERWATLRNQLDNLVKQGKVNYAYEVFDVYLQRVSERTAEVHKLIDANHDFTVDEVMVTDPDTLDWASSVEEINDRWRKRIKYDLLTLKLDESSDKEKKTKNGETKTEEAKKEDPRERLHKRYDNIRRMATQTEDHEKLELFLTSLVQSFDPHSSYMSPESLEDFQIQMRLSLEGIGAALRSEDGYTVVAEIVNGGAAAADGRLKVGDKIIGVAQESDPEGQFVDVVEMKLNRVVRHIRGPKATKVRLQVKTAAANEIKVYELTRQTIELKSAEVKGEIINSGDRVPGTNTRIGVVHIPSFYRDFQGAQEEIENFKSTARDVLKVLEEFERKGGVDLLVIDLRWNGGGALTEAVEVTGLFIDQGPVVQVKEENGRIEEHNDEIPNAASDRPMIVLCNRLSASASEIFAGAIKDYGRGIIVGDRTTHGKGTVQNVMPVSSGLIPLVASPTLGALKLTISQFYRVNGDSTQNAGVPSDIVLPSLIDNMDLGESFLEHALAFDHVDPAKYAPVDMVSPEIVSNLRQQSERRVNGDPKFVEAQQSIAKYLERKDRKEITLNEEKLRAERKEDKKAEEATAKADKLEEGQSDEGPIFPDTYYNNEVINIGLDYLRLLNGQKTAQK